MNTNYIIDLLSTIPFFIWLLFGYMTLTIIYTKWGHIKLNELIKESDKISKDQNKREKYLNKKHQELRKLQRDLNRKKGIR